MEPWWEWLSKQKFTDDFGLEERVVEVIEVHADVVDGDQ